jgi:hypothetical protein
MNTNKLKPFAQTSRRILVKNNYGLTQLEYEAEDIPAATQIFTPNWRVKYMVHNTIGRLKNKMKYLVESSPLAKGESKGDWSELESPEQREQVKLVEGFSLLDPA